MRVDSTINYNMLLSIKDEEVVPFLLYQKSKCLFHSMMCLRTGRKIKLRRSVLFGLINRCYSDQISPIRVYESDQ